MNKPLNEMSNEELWQLFPIILSEHKAYWKEYYIAEKEFLENLIGNNIEAIHHIGSTAIPNLTAKPTIDILIEISDNTDIPGLIRKMEINGYIYSPQPDKPAPHLMFLKGYTSTGFASKVFHIHIRYKGDWDELHFRDYLLSHPEAVKEYVMLKQKLKEQYEHDRDGYTMAKTDFIRRITDLARDQNI
ncbi:MAG: GrpB family protein [Dysgonomonas sp.]|nr:GrpB family protein [Dysgonomonas sp.]